ncbi:MAG: HigA family addiction module antitoxin [Acidobacteriaceae bacterium]|jgi:addiction module HigA family antidote
MGMYNPPHPGALIADILENGDLSIGSSVTEVARHLGVTRATLSRVINGRSGVSAEMALKLQDAFGVRADLWLGLQFKRDLWLASRKRRRKVASALLKKAA